MQGRMLKGTRHAHRLFRHVNRKALDQFATFTDQRAELQRRQGDNERGEAKIRQLIDTLDLRKDEAIERTFKARLCSPGCPMVQGRDGVRVGFSRVLGLIDALDLRKDEATARTFKARGSPMGAHGLGSRQVWWSFKGDDSSGGGLLGLSHTLFLEVLQQKHLAMNMAMVWSHARLIPAC